MYGETTYFPCETENIPPKIPLANKKKSLFLNKFVGKNKNKIRYGPCYY